ncbi:MAG: hypothetical protein CMM01_22865 [Rhodopirellula sp.]|nr:hypothetical protein [Rhodopirellula sp.]
MTRDVSEWETLKPSQNEKRCLKTRAQNGNSGFLGWGPGSSAYVQFMIVQFMIVQFMIVQFMIVQGLALPSSRQRFADLAGRTPTL